MPTDPTAALGDAPIDVLVAGGGIAGLTAATFAAKAGLRTVLLERRVPGGRARTDRRGEVLWNQGPRALYRGGEALTVLQELGITPAGERPPAKGGLVWRTSDDALSLLPGGAGSLLRTDAVSTRSKVQVGKILGLLPRIDATKFVGQSVAQWIAGQGLRDDAAELLRTVVRVATYADDLDRLSADAAITQVQRAVSVGVIYVDGGWQSIVDALAAAAVRAGVRIVDHLGVDAVEGELGGFEVTASATNGDADPVALRAGAVVVAGGGPEGTKAILGDVALADPGPAVHAACLDLAVRRHPGWPIILGMGEGLYLSVHNPPAKLAPEGTVVLHGMRYGTTNAADDRAIIDRLVARSGIRQEEVLDQRFLAKMVVAQGSPVPGSGLAGRPGVAVPGLPGAFVAGDWVGPDGMLGDAAVASGKAAALAASAALGTRPRALAS